MSKRKNDSDGYGNNNNKNKKIIGDSYWSNQFTKWTTSKYKCVRCGNFFHEVDNIGRWQCWQHPVIVIPVVGEVWPCCGKKFMTAKTATNKGCVRADHSTHMLPYDEQWNTPIPSVIFEQLGLKNNAPCIIKRDDPNNPEKYRSKAEYDEAINYKTIRRYDLNATEQRNYLL